MPLHEEHERTIEANAEMEQNRQAWAKGLATGAIRFYRRGWRDFEDDERGHENVRPGAETSPDERQAVFVDDGQRLQATGGAEAWRSRESGGATTTMSADRPHARSIDGREDEPEAAGLGGERETEPATVSGVQTGTLAASESGTGSQLSHDH
ncbi:hypothetical protein LTR91_017586 [Friedmanniomyces endolithicus]|uniref:Uncharacterized protein n=1 Tax=Friedmanniomyces endolithicus TaxID=329885 RepID=A0AAN6K651_9PEZI|nr:hypothetical protein LTR94_016688 [Friedmanniomyces endolithicus]KAK0775112.1 hypothetical protein LTR59_014637 [Friedmanniomyces endolithicus]KAK0780667.1 hypothetical protein LTR38_014006 [Friedmanniomyces endolithicus]KAK0791192.1 hypothetical protein LTR75_011844 [Friedmanniomyces endolithicus]KAK0835490.1 hypothetical protein LTR03_013872 [Friedmanniomyces endolithicus]